MPNSFSEWIQIMPSVGAVILTAVAVKWLDDCIDEDNLTNSMRGGAAYSLTAILVASVLDLPLTIALFSACFMIGMFSSMTIKLPSGLPGWLESSLLFMFASVYSGLRTAIWAVLVIYSVQILDDLLDYNADHQRCIFNLARAIGIEQSMILFLFCFYLSVAIEPMLSVLVLSSALFVANVLFDQKIGGKLDARVEHG
ncbi:MAG: hypothetical protein GX228_00695 [Firmicutes bacterium]|nr:hypothetical protein [Bacillota bacterium]NLL87435.1 hypothetical protein [Bacillota bacterium]